MTYSPFQPYGVAYTPKVVKILILLTSLISLFTTLTNNLVEYLFNVPGPESWLSLSWYGINNLYLWQPLTFLFVENSNSMGITFSYLFVLFINMYILWSIGSHVAETIGEKAFIKFYLSVGILSGIITLIVMKMTGLFGLIAGPTPVILGLFILWAMLYPEKDILLFFLLPLKVKWVAVGLLTIILLINFSQLNFVGFTYYLSGIVLSYLFALFIWDLKSPFLFLEKPERLLQKIKQKPFFNKIRKKQGKTAPKSKIFDFESGEPVLDDEEFIDSMLTKISKYGEKSLSTKEKQRMQSISERKRREQNNH